MKADAALYKKVKLALLFLMLLFSILSYKIIPYWSHVGLDFQNIHAFHNSISPNNPYAIDGKTAGDVGERNMLYPPLLYFLFFWTRWVSFPFGSVLWAGLILAMTGISLPLWVSKEESRAVGIWLFFVFTILLIIQYPVLFAAERGNNDILILLAWTLSFLFYSRKRYLLSGILAGLSAVMKLYTGFACVVIGVGILFSVIQVKNSKDKRLFFILGGVGSVIAISLLFWPLTKTYFSSVLPLLRKERANLTVFCHSIMTIFQGTTDALEVWGSQLMSGVLILVWCYASVKNIKQDSKLVFAGGIAISTYFAGVSYDYNLVTALPLLVILFIRSFREDSYASEISYLLLLVGVFGVIGHRGFFMASRMVLVGHILIQYAWLFSVALLGEVIRPSKMNTAI